MVTERQVDSRGRAGLLVPASALKGIAHFQISSPPACVEISLDLVRKSACATPTASTSPLAALENRLSWFSTVPPFSGFALDQGNGSCRCKAEASVTGKEPPERRLQPGLAAPRIPQNPDNVYPTRQDVQLREPHWNRE
jgi:hypothetical protein